MGLGFLDQLEEVLGVAPADVVGLPGGLEALEGELADRLVHPEAVIGAADETLLDERGEGVEVSVRNRFGGFERGASGEDRQTRE